VFGAEASACVAKTMPVRKIPAKAYSRYVNAAQSAGSGFPASLLSLACFC